MRTTVRIDDHLLNELKQRAHAEGVSLTCLINRVLHQGLQQPAARSRRRFRQQAFSMGSSSFSLDKALAFTAELEDEEILRKMAMRK